MVATETLENFLLNQPAQIDLTYLVFSLILSAILAYALGKLYIRYGTALSNRKRFASNFVLLTTTTTLIIMIVKSSLALSLGLVGALSIVRFRSAIKEPEELSFLFLCIAIGLGFGAGQVAITLVSFILISTFIWARHLTHKKEESQNLCLTVSGRDIGLRDIVNVLRKSCNSVHLKRFDQLENNILEASFLVDFNSFSDLERSKEDLNKLSKSINITYLDKFSI